MSTFSIVDFVRESNRIEGILREPTKQEVSATERFLALDTLTIGDIQQLVSVYAPGKFLRTKPGMNVRVGSHIAPAGGPEIVERLQDLIVAITEHHIDPWIAHCTYEDLHPFMDGNGRSGRALWAWMMQRENGGFPLGFLHHFYYQTLAHSANRAAFYEEINTAMSAGKRE